MTTWGILHMAISDKRIIEFLSKSPLQTFSAMLDTLSYLDGQWIEADLEYELFDYPLGDNAEGRSTIRVPALKGIEANALLSFTQHAVEFHLITRNPRKTPSIPPRPPELIVFYSLTAAGREVLEVIRAIDKARSPAGNSGATLTPS
jgi:hypothetical protein